MVFPKLKNNTDSLTFLTFIKLYRISIHVLDKSFVCQFLCIMSTSSNKIKSNQPRSSQINLDQTWKAMTHTITMNPQKTITTKKKNMTTKNIISTKNSMTTENTMTARNTLTTKNTMTTRDAMI